MRAWTGGEHEAGVAGDDEDSWDPAMAPAPLVSTLGHAGVSITLALTRIGIFGREFEVDPGYPLRHPDPDRG